MKGWVTAYFMCGLYFIGVCDGDSARPNGHPFRFIALRITVFLLWPAFLAVGFVLGVNEVMARKKQAVAKGGE